jgi:hypothetical protein
MSARLMAFVVSGVVKTNEGRKVNPSFLPRPKRSTPESMLNGYTQRFYDQDRPLGCNVNLTERMQPDHSRQRNF